MIQQVHSAFIPPLGLRINGKGIVENSKLDKALKIVTAFPKKNSTEKDMYQVARNGITNVGLSNTDPDTLEISTQLAGKNQTEFVHHDRYTIDELANQVKAIIKHLNGDFDTPPKGGVEQ